MARIPGPVLHTDRLRLAVPKLRDVPDIYRWVKDRRVTRYMSWESPRRRRETLEFVHTSAREQRRGESISYVLHERASGTPIGCCGAHHLHGTQGHKVEVGYWLARPYWGRGFVSEAMTAFLAFAFTTLDLERVSAQVFVGNGRSSRVLERLGFQFEGTMRHSLRKGNRFHSVHLYGLLRRDRLARRIIAAGERA